MREIWCFLLFLASLVNCQTDTGLGALELPEELAGEEEKPETKDILVIPNHFPKDLNFFCYPRTGLQHDRLCFGQLDAFALACADDTPPLQLVPFCIAFKDQCSRVNYPQETWCHIERKQYKKFCTRNKRQSCKSCHYDLSCSCEPFECLWRRYGFETARWCQRYELFCNNKVRRDKAQDLIIAMKDSIKVHYKCFHMFNLANVICNPFRKQFDHQRCMKFLFDCELISDFEEEEAPKKATEEEGEEVVVPPSGSIPGKTEVPLTPKEKEDLKKIQVEEEKLAKEIDQAAKAELQGKNMTNGVNPLGMAPDRTPVGMGVKPPEIPEQPFEKITLVPSASSTSRPVFVVSQPPSPHAVGPIMMGLSHPLERITLAPVSATETAPIVVTDGSPVPITVAFPSSAAPVAIAHSPLGDATHPEIPKNPFKRSRQ